jgi:hypothetical protein
VNTFASDDYTGRPDNYWQDYEAKMRAVTADDVSGSRGNTSIQIKQYSWSSAIPRLCRRDGIRTRPDSSISAR